MNKVVSFLDNYYGKAVTLSNSFGVTRNYEWTPLLILNELSIQVGQIYNIIYQSEAVNENDRIFTNLGDELSDVLLQTIALADSLDINLYHVSELAPIKEDNWFSLPIIIGQLNESIMEKYGYRFTKPRLGFDNIEEFIENRILRLLDITYQIAIKYNLDIEIEFQKMLDEANGFLDRFHDKEKLNEYVRSLKEKQRGIVK